jgi:membrane protein DedA with SNARE-associated domain
VRIRTLLVAVLAALCGAFAWYLFGERHAPPGQPPLATLDAASLDTLRSEFNAHADKVRIVVLLSPT